jgi:hypothetical protein
MVVVAPPEIQFPPRIGQVEEHLHVQALVAQLAIEAFDEAVLHRSSWPDEVQVHTVSISPVVQRLRRELGAVVHGDRLRRTALHQRLVQRCCDLFSAQRVVGQQRHALPRVLVHHRQHPYPATVRQPLRHEVHRPLLVRPHRRSLRHTLPLRSFLALLRPHDQALFDIQPVDALRVDLPAFSLQQHSQPTLTVTHTAAGKLSQMYPQGLLRVAMVVVAQRHPIDRNQLRHAPLAHLVDLLRPLSQLATRTRPYSFFRTISCNT